MKKTIVAETPENFDSAKFAKAHDLEIDELWQEGRNTVYPARIGKQDLSLYVNVTDLEDEFRAQGCSDADVLAALMEASNDKKVKELKSKRDGVKAARDDKKEKEKIEDKKNI